MFSAHVVDKHVSGPGLAEPDATLGRGTDVVARIVARRYGPEGRVVAVDVGAPLLVEASRRLAARK